MCVCANASIFAGLCHTNSKFQVFDTKKQRVGRCPQTSLKFLDNLWVLCASRGGPAGLVGGSCQLLCLLILSRAWRVEGAQLTKS